MSTTPLGFRYPSLTDPPNTPLDLQNLANDLDAYITAWRPKYSAQLAQPGFGTVGSFVDFTGGQWPTLTFTVPPSGRFWVSISANIDNNNTVTSTCWATWRVSTGTLTLLGNQANDTPGPQGLSSGSGGRNNATKRVYCSGTPGASITLTPQWYISSGSSSTADIMDGLLAVEPVL